MKYKLPDGSMAIHPHQALQAWASRVATLEAKIAAQDAEITNLTVAGDSRARAIAQIKEIIDRFNK